MNKHAAWQKKGLLVLVFLLVIGFYWVRLINLDQDLPPWGIALYQPKDEGCYALLALNQQEYGMMNPENPLRDDGSKMYVQEHIRTNYLGNLLEIAGFNLYGDNYFGLRVPAVAVGFLNLICMAIILLLLRKRYGHGDSDELWAIVALLLLTELHFYFYVSNRVVEPSTMRMLFAQFVMLLWLLLDKHRYICMFVIGACISCSIFLVYVTNSFLVLALALLLLLLWRWEGFKSFFFSGLWLLIGALMMLGVAELYYHHVWNCSALGNAFNAVTGFAGSSGYEVALSGIGLMVRGFFKGIARFFSAKWFLYAPAVLLLSIALLPHALDQVRKRDATIALMLLIPAALLIQTMVSDDFIWRKLIVVAPYTIYLLFWGLGCQKILPGMSDEDDEIPILQKIPVLRKITGLWWLVLSASFTVLMMLFHLSISHDLAKIDFTKWDKLTILLLGCGGVIAYVIYLFICHVKNSKPAQKIALGILVSTTFLINIVFLGQYVWLHPAFTERDMMKSLSEEYHLDGSYIVGDFCMGITLYNDLHHVTDHYKNCPVNMVGHDDVYMIHYIDDNSAMRQYIDDVIFSPNSDYTALRVVRLPSSFRVYGSIRDMALYTAVPREEAISAICNEYKKKYLEIASKIQELESKRFQMDWEEYLDESDKLQEEMNNLQSPYPISVGIVQSIYVDVNADIYGDIYGDVHATVNGNIYGDVYGTIFGDVYGNIYGNVYTKPLGTIHGQIFGEEFY